MTSGAPRAEVVPSAGTGLHIPVLDGLRGVAILLVLLLHFGQFGHGLPAPTVWIDRLFMTVVRTGWTGVDLFFVLSGFLITGILYDTKGSPHYFRQFYARRILRIFPLYYGTLLVFLVLLPSLWPRHEVLRDLKADAWWYWSYLYNVKAARSGFTPTSALGHFWSLAVEEQFYLVWPTVVLFLGRRHLLAACAAGVVGALLIRTGLLAAGYHYAPDVLTPARMDALAIGGFIAVIAREPAGLERLRRWAGPIAAVVALPLAGLLAYDVARATIGYTLVAVFFGAVLVLVLTAAPGGMVGRVFSAPLLTVLGRYSYALYVFHFPLLWFRPAVSVRSVPTVLGSQLPSYALWLLMAIGATFLLALLSWQVVERPALRLKRFFPYESGSGASTRTAPPPAPAPPLH